MARSALKRRPLALAEPFKPEPQLVVSPPSYRTVEPSPADACAEPSSQKQRNTGFYFGAAAVIAPPALVLWSGHPIAAIAVFALCGFATALVAAAARSLDDSPPYMKL